MRDAILSSQVLFTSIAAFALAACTDPTPIGGGAGGGGGDDGTTAAVTTAQGAGGGNPASTSSGTQGAGGANPAATSSGSGATCHGDAADWATITATPIACAKNSDCCVVVNTCLSEVQVVHADDFQSAGAAWPYCDDECTLCIAPDVEVGCVDGVCVGEAKAPAGVVGTDHCGEDAAPVDPVNPGQTFGCGG